MNNIGLVIDCCNQWLMCGLYGPGISVERVEKAPRKAFLFLHDWIYQLLDESKIKKPDWIACTLGPGSFTGTRICVSTARNLSQLWNIPVTGLDSTGFVARQIASLKPELRRPLGVMIDGRQKKVYAQLFNNLDSGYHFDLFQNIIDVEPDEFIANCPGDTVYYADDRDFIRNYSNDKKSFDEIEIYEWPMPNPRVLYDYILESGKLDQDCEWGQLKPLYIRPDPAHEKK